MPTVQIDENHQRQLVQTLLALKIAQLDKLRGILGAFVTHNVVPADEVIPRITAIDAETGRCRQAFAQLNARTISFPSSQQIADLQAAVNAVSAITIQNATIQSVATALANLVTTFPP